MRDADPDSRSDATQRTLERVTSCTAMAIHQIESVATSVQSVDGIMKGGLVRRSVVEKGWWLRKRSETQHELDVTFVDGLQACVREIREGESERRRQIEQLRIAVEEHELGLVGAITLRCENAVILSRDLRRFQVSKSVCLRHLFREVGIVPQFSGLTDLDGGEQIPSATQVIGYRDALHELLWAYDQINITSVSEADPRGVPFVKARAEWDRFQSDLKRLTECIDTVTAARIALRSIDFLTTRRREYERWCNVAPTYVKVIEGVIAEVRTSLPACKPTGSSGLVVLTGIPLEKALEIDKSVQERHRPALRRLSKLLPSRTSVAA